MNEPLIIRAESVDHRFYLCISSCINAAWVPVEDVAISANHEEWLDAWDIPAGQELVVTGYKVFTEKSEQTPNISKRMLYMGTVLERVDLSNPEEALEIVGTSSAFDRHVCYLPVRNENGAYSKELALIGTSAKVSEGYLPLTAANIAEIALRSLGKMYGWGGMLEANDCSGYVRDVYDGKLYVISALGGIGDIYDLGGKSYQVKGVVINTLDMLRANRNSWLTTLTCANIPYISNSIAGPGVYDMAFYENAITLSKDSYKHTGERIMPEVSIDGLEKGVDYNVLYENNVKLGTATVTVSGAGDYSGSVSKSFQIEKIAQTIKAKKSVGKTVKASAKTKALAKTKTFSLKKLAYVSAKTKVKCKKANKAGGKKIVVSASTGKVALKKGLKKGTYKVKVKLTAPASDSYKAAKAKTITLKIVVK